MRLPKPWLHQSCQLWAYVSLELPTHHRLWHLARHDSARHRGSHQLGLTLHCGYLGGHGLSFLVRDWEGGALKDEKLTRAEMSSCIEHSNIENER
ncbi:unnamed protein product [Lupinus luteus]|uniref:Uncharacterized protein n=1 Tax=Lupinus luteus TaxID=3873 RepID=A0AAV1W1Q0_LUPLU